MGLYNLVFDVDPAVTLVLTFLGATPSDFGRFRDAWIDRMPDESLRLVVYTRNGGANREEHMPKNLAKHPLYLGDQDDKFDETYASIYFRMPENWREIAREKIKRELIESAPEDMREELLANTHDFVSFLAHS